MSLVSYVEIALRHRSAAVELKADSVREPLFKPASGNALKSLGYKNAQIGQVMDSLTQHYR